MPMDPELEARIAKARAQGATWDQINGALGQRINAAKAAGATDDQINTAFGGGVSQEAARPVTEPLRQAAQENLSANPGTQASVVTDPLGAFKAGLQASSGGLVLRGKLPSTVTPEHLGFISRLAREAGEMTGDVPAMIAGAIGGGALGGGGGAAAGAAVPGVGETGVSEVAGGVTGAAIAGGAGTMALPQFIKSAYVDGLNKGLWKSPEEFAVRTAGVLWDTTKAGMVGAATAGVGGHMDVALGKAATALNPFAKLGIKTTAELATMTGVNSALNGKLPTKEDIIDGAAMLAFFHVAGGGGKAISEKLVSNATRNLGDHFVGTDEHPVAAAQAAVGDPIQRTKLLNTPEPAPHPLDAQKATDSGVFTVSHIPTTFDDEVKFVMDKQEGGGRLNTDTGGVTKWGISSKNNPDVDVKNLSREQAQSIYHERYWKPIGADNIQDPKLRLAAFDSAVNEGVGPTKEWLKQAGGDLQTFLALRTEKYRQLIDSKPEVYGKYEASWNARLERLGATETIRGMKAPEGAPGGAGVPPVPPKPPEEPERPSFEDDPWGAIRSTMSEFDTKEEPGIGVGDRISGQVEKIYREMVNPEHPIWKLQDAAEKNGPLPDLENPRQLWRLSELAGDRGMALLKSEHAFDLEGNVTGPSLGRILDGLKGKEWDDFWTYGKAKWAAEKADQAKETGVEADAARQVVAQGDPKYGERFKQLVDFQNITLSHLRDSGLMSQEGYNKAVAETAAYIPGFRVQENEKPSVGAPGPARSAFNPVKRFLGSDKKTEPIFENIVKQTLLRAELAARNKATVATAELAEKLNLGGYEAAPARKVVLTAAELEKAVKDPGALDLDGDNGTFTVFRRIAAGLDKDQVPVFQDGKMRAFKFEDPQITSFIRGWDKTSRDTLTRYAAKATDITRKMIVMSPDFPVRLLQYDIPWQFITKPGFRNTVAGAYLGMSELFGKATGGGEMYDRWVRSGGAEGVFGHLSRDAYIKDVLQGKDDPSFGTGAWNAIQTPYHALRAWGQTLSQAPRLGRFIQGVSAGESDVAAGAASSDAAFHRPGYGGPGVKNMNAIHPFFAAQVNSLEQTIRGQFGIGKTITGEKFDPLAFTAKAAALMTLPVLATWFANKDKEWYKAAPDYQKDNGLLFHIGPEYSQADLASGKVKDFGHTLYYKFPPLISLLYAGIPRRLAEAFLHDNPHAMDGFGRSLGEALLPGGGFLNASLFMPVVEHIANYSFFKDHPLVPDDVRRSAMAPEQFTQYNSDTARTLSKFVNDVPLLKNLKLSPPVIDNYIQAWGGGLGEAAIRSAEGAYHNAKGDRPASGIEDWPLLHSWLSRYPAGNIQPVEDFRRRMDEFNSVHGSLVRLVESGDLSRFTKVAQENSTAALAHAFKMRNDPMPSNAQDYASVLEQAGRTGDRNVAQSVILADKALKYMNTYVKFVYANDNMSPRDKRQLIDQAYGQMQVVAERGIQQLDAMDKGQPTPKLELPAVPTPPRNAPRAAVAAPTPGAARGEVPIS